MTTASAAVRYPLARVTYGEEEIAAVEQNNLTDQVKVAVREYLERRDRLPKPKPRGTR